MEQNQIRDKNVPKQRRSNFYPKNMSKTRKKSTTSLKKLIWENPNQYPDRTDVFELNWFSPDFFILKIRTNIRTGLKFLKRKWSGPDFFILKIQTNIRTGPKFLYRKWSGPDFFILKKTGPQTGPQKNPDRYGLSGPKNPDHGPDQWKSGPENPDHGPDQENPDQIIRTR